MDHSIAKLVLQPGQLQVLVGVGQRSQAATAYERDIGRFKDIVPPPASPSPFLAHYLQFLRRLEFLSAFKEEMCGRYRRTTQEEELARPGSTHSDPNECRVTIKETTYFHAGG